MALKKQLVSIDLTGGINTKTDEKQVHPPQTLKIENGIYTTDKAITKRNGFVELPDSGFEAVGSLFEGTLVASTGTSLGAYNPDLDVWKYYGGSAAQTLSIRELLSSPAAITQVASTFDDRTGRLFMVWNSFSPGMNVFSPNYGVYDVNLKVWVFGPVHIGVDTTSVSLTLATDIAGVVGADQVYLGAEFLGGANNGVEIFSLGSPAVPTTPVSLVQIPTTVTGQSPSPLAIAATTYQGGTYIGIVSRANPPTTNPNFTYCTVTAPLTVTWIGVRTNVAVGTGWAIAASQAATGGFSIGAFIVAGSTAVAVVPPTLPLGAATLAYGGVAPGGTTAITSSPGRIVVATMLLDTAGADYLHPSIIQIATNTVGFPTSVVRTVDVGVTLSQSTWGIASQPFIVPNSNNNLVGVWVYGSGAASNFVAGNYVCRAIDLTTGNVSTLGQCFYGRALRPYDAATPPIPALALTLNGQVTTVLVRADATESFSASTLFYSCSLVAVTLTPSNAPKLVSGFDGVYQTGASPFVFDGQETSDPGYLVYPEMTDYPANNAKGWTTAGTGTAFAGDLEYAFVYSRYNTKGEVLRSEPSRITIPNAFATGKATITFHNVPQYGGSYLEIYQRPLAAASPFVLQYVLSYDQATSVTLNLPGPILGGTELYTDGGELPNDPMPPADVILFSKQRGFALPSDDPSAVFITKPLAKGVPAEWIADATFYVDPAAGANTALGLLDDKLVVFKADAIYYFQGDGPDATGEGSFGEPVRLPAEVGCISPRSVITLPDGIMFQSRRGIELLTRGLTLEWVGAPLNGILADEIITTAIVLPVQQHVRFNNKFIYDYLNKIWSTFSGVDSSSAVVVEGMHYFLQPGGIVARETPGAYLDNGVTPIVMTIVTPHYPLAGILQGYGRLYRLGVLGAYKSAHTMNVTLNYNYGAQTYVVPFNTVTGLVNGDVGYQFRLSRVPQQIAESVQIQLQDSAITGESCSITNIVLELGNKGGIDRLALQKSV